MSKTMWTDHMLRMCCSTFTITEDFVSREHIERILVPADFSSHRLPRQNATWTRAFEFGAKDSFMLRVMCS